MLHDIVKHEKIKYKCQKLPYDCPFSQKQFLHRIEFGEKIQKDFLTRRMDSVKIHLVAIDKGNKLCLY